MKNDPSFAQDNAEGQEKEKSSIACSNGVYEFNQNFSIGNSIINGWTLSMEIERDSYVSRHSEI